MKGTTYILSDHKTIKKWNSVIKNVIVHITERYTRQEVAHCLTKYDKQLRTTMNFYQFQLSSPIHHTKSSMFRAGVTLLWMLAIEFVHIVGVIFGKCFRIISSRHLKRCSFMLIPDC